MSGHQHQPSWSPGTVRLADDRAHRHVLLSAVLASVCGRPKLGLLLLLRSLSRLQCNSFADWCHRLMNYRSEHGIGWPGLKAPIPERVVTWVQSIPTQRRGEGWGCRKMPQQWDPMRCPLRADDVIVTSEINIEVSVQTTIPFND